jgi:hypothetical protein
LTKPPLEITARVPDDGDDGRPPSYSDPGRVLFRWYRDPEFSPTGWSVEVYDYDNDSCLFWMAEGCGIDYVLGDILQLEQEGWCIAAGITGSIWKDCDGEVDEEWYLEGPIRYATDEEIRTEALT